MSWHCQSTYGWSDPSTTEWQDNVTEITAFLRGYNWTDEAIAGVIGNMVHESGINPWRWQDNNIQSSTSYSSATSVGYGLMQFTPSGKYIDTASSYEGYGPNFSDIPGNIGEGHSQLLWFLNHTDQWGPASWSEYPDVSMSEYSQMNLETIDTMVYIFMANYERPLYEYAMSSLVQRQTYGRQVYEFITDHPIPGGRMPKWMLFKLAQNNNFWKKMGHTNFL